jgi:hypothetical protein
MDIQWNTIFPSLVIPALLLHEKGKKGTENKKIKKDHPPNTLACRFNQRNLQLPKFNCTEDDKDNIVKVLRKEKKSDYFSCLDGTYIFCLTSFKETNQVQEDNVMQSILRASEQKKGAESIVAIPLTGKILEDALRWLKGNTDTGEASLANGQTERTIEELVTAYLDSLSKAIPAKSDVATLMDFIKSHDWPDGSLEEMLEELSKKEHDDMEKSYFLRGFIHQNLARKTKVVAHFVDGNHRAAALNCALIGSGDDVVKAKREYYENFPHAEKNVLAVIIVPIGPINSIFADKMRSTSQKSQSTCSKQQSHTVRENLFHLIEIVRKQCLQNGISYLWRGLGELMRNDVDSVLPTYLEQNNYQPFINYAQHVTDWIGKVSEEILHVLEKEVDNLHLSSGKDGKAWRNLFKPKVSPTSAEYTIFHIFPFSKSNILANFLADSPNDVFKTNRFLRTGFSDKDLIIVQFLLWSMISKEANQHLRLLFSNSNPKQHQQVKPNVGTESEDAWKWTMSFFHNVTESVYNSYDPWKKFFFVADPQIPIQCNQDMVIYLCLLTSAIKECAPFFMDVGTNPIWPEELVKAVKDINMNIVGENKNLVTFYTKAHSIAMTRAPKQQKMIILQEIYLDHWRMRWKNFSNNERGILLEMKRCVVRKRDRNWKRMANLLNLITVGGVSSPDPRGRRDNYKHVIEIIGSNVDPNNYGTETFYSTQIHQFVQVLPKDSKLLELVKNGGKVIRSKKIPLSLEVDRGSIDVNNNLGDENYLSPRAPPSLEVDRGSIDANPSLLAGGNVGADGTSPSPPLQVTNALDNVGADGTGSDVPTCTRDTAVAALGTGGTEPSAGGPQVPVQDVMDTSPTIHTKTRKKARKAKSIPENIPSGSVNLDLAHECSQVYDLADFWEKHIKPILKDEEFAEAKKLIDDALHKIQPENNLGENKCLHCDKNSLTWSSFCEEHTKIFTKQYFRKKPPKRGILALVEQKRHNDLQFEDETRANMAAMHGNGADSAGGVIDFDGIEVEQPRRSGNRYVLEEASEGARDGSSIGELSLATNTFKENCDYEGDVTFKNLVVDLDANDLITQGREHFKKSGNPYVLEEASEGGRDGSSIGELSEVTNNFKEYLGDVSLKTTGGAGLDANDLITQGREHFKKQRNMKYFNAEGEDRSCEWETVRLCQVCGTGASLIPCHKEGCQYHLHKLCQTMWENEDTCRKSDGDWCSKHHPTYSNYC